MRLRLFEHVRRLAHPRAGRLWLRRDRAGETARHARPGELRSPGHLAGGHGQVPPASSEAAGRHRRNSQEAAGLSAHDLPASRPGPSWADETGAPWPPDESGPPWPDERRGALPPAAGPGNAAGGPPDRRPLNVSPRTGGETAGRPGGEAP